MRAYGPGGKNKYGDFTPGANSDDNECPDNCVRLVPKYFFSEFSTHSCVNTSFFNYLPNYIIKGVVPKFSKWKKLSPKLE